MMIKTEASVGRSAWHWDWQATYSRHPFNIGLQSWEAEQEGFRGPTFTLGLTSKIAPTLIVSQKYFAWPFLEPLEKLQYEEVSWGLIKEKKNENVHMQALHHKSDVVLVQILRYNCSETHYS